MRKTRIVNVHPRDEDSKFLDLPVVEHNSLVTLGQRRTGIILRDSQGNMKLTDMLAAAYVQGLTDMAIAVGEKWGEALEVDDE